MTPELIGIITIGIALAAVNLTMWNRIDKRLDRIDDRLSAQGERQARLEGALEVIREALIERVLRVRHAH